MNFVKNQQTITSIPVFENARPGFSLQKYLSCASVLLLMPTQIVVADPLRKSSPLYENPFDLSAGGASLTRATQEGMFFSNPSLPALGKGLLRWIYGRTAVHFGADAVDLARSSYQKKKAGTLKVD